MAITLDPAAGYISFMNVFDDPNAQDMSCGGGYCFGVFNWGFNGFDHPDLVATFNGDELTLQGTPLPDPSPYWYDTPGGPGVIGNNIMEANHFVEDQSGQYNGSNLSYSVEVASIDFSCGHETSLYIREFAPGFAFIINETFVPLTGTGVFTVTMPISATPGNIVQYGHQTVGNNLWPTDVDGCGSAVLLPVENTVTWYNAPVGGDVQGNGLTLDPTGTIAEEGAFDPNTAGSYTYYAECMDGNGCVSERTPVVFTVQMVPEPPVVVNEPVVCDGGPIDPNNLLEAECPTVMTLDPNAGYISFMNVFDDPNAQDMSCGGGYCFGVFNWGFNGFDHPDLVATFNGDELTLQGTPLPDPSAYWYDTPGGPGVIGNNIMEANHFVEDQSGQFLGTDLSYAVEVLSIDFSCGHETSIYIREFTPGFALVNEAMVPLTGPGIFTVTMPVSNTPGHIVQYGHQTVGNNLWPTDVDGCGAAVLAPATPEVAWYNAETGGDLQGMGEQFDPTGTTAEQGPFDINTPGEYCFYAECVAEYTGDDTVNPNPLTCISERTKFTFTVVGFDILTATQICNYTSTDLPHDYDIELCFDVLQGGPSGLFDVYVDDGDSPNMVNIDEYNGAQQDNFAYDDLGPSIDGSANNCVILNSADFNASDLSTVTVSIIDWDVANMENGTTVDIACSSIDFEEFLCCNPDAGTQSEGPIEVCTDVETSLAPAGTVGTVDVTFENLPQEPEAGVNNYAWIITDSNLDIVNVVGSENYDVDNPVSFSDDILLSDAAGNMLGIGTYCIHGINYRDASIAANANMQGTIDLAGLQGLVGTNAADIVNELLENDGVLTMSGADGTFTVCADLNVQGCTPVIINPTPEVTVQPEDDYVCEGDDAVFTVSAFVLPGDHLDPNPSTLNFVIEWSQDEGTSWNEFPAAIADPEQPILGPTGEETVNFTIPAVGLNMNCSLWRVVVTADHNPDPDCFIISESARLFVHGGGQMQCNNKVNYSFDENCEINPSVTDFFEGDFDACDVDIHTYMNTFYRVEFETFGGIPVAAEDLSEQLSYGGGCLIYNVIDNCTGNSCWGEICVEDKLPPEIECPCPPGAWITDPTCQIDCSDIDRYLNGQRGTPTIFEACEDADAVFGGATATEVECGVYVVTQNWWVETEGPNGQVYSDISCTNEYYVTVPDLMDELDCPDDVEYDCSEDITEESFSPEETGYPEFDNVEINNTVENSYCNIFAAYEDLEVPSCDGCYGPVKIFRTWQVINWCTAEISVCEQIIKVTDSTPPSILADDITVSTEPWNCSADVWLPDPQLHDDCDYDLDWCIATTNSGATLVDEDGRTNQGKPLKHALGVPKGTWEFTLKSTDCCGNNGYYTINVTVADLTPPVVVATQNIVVSLTSSGDDWDGSAKIYKDAIDNGSHDNCSGVWAEIRRDEDACDVEGNTTYSNKLPQQCDPWYDNDDHDYGEYVKFCCADLTEIDSVTGVSYGIVKVWMRVWDDGNMDGVYGSYTYYDNPGNDHDYCDLEDNYNEIWVNVRVEDKAPVSLICPPDVTIPCHWDWTDTSITGEAQASATCGHPEVQYTDWPEVHCGEGYVLREWSVEGYEYVCVQRITVTPVETPLEVICPIYEDFAAIGDNPPITWFNPFEPNHVSVDCEDFEFPEPVQYGGKCNLVGVSSTVDTFWFEEDACFKAIKTWHYVDWCTEDEFECEFVVSVIDTEAPMVMCQDTCFAVDDYWDDDEDGNYCELEDDVEVQSMAIDEGDCESIWIKWVATVDYWYDGVIDEEYSSFVAPNDPFYVAPTASGDPVSIELDKDELGGEWARHLVEWKAFDGCGNVDQCVQVVEVADKKAPTPYCVGLSTSIMTPEAGNLVEIWAKDFNLGSFDNCTQEHWLKYTFNEVPPVVDLIDEEHCFKPVWEDRDNCLPLRDENGNIVSEEDNNCSDYEDGATRPDCPLDAVQKWDPNGVDEDGNPCKTSGVKFVGLEWCGVNPIRVSVWDNKFNTDFCWVDLIVHGVECDNTATPRIEGEIATETGANVEGAMVTNSGADLIQTDMTDENGHYAFDFNIMGEDYALAVEKNNDWLNGVSTLDLVLIQQHVLGINELNSGYRLVAADINNDESVSAVDLIELRKLILGIYSDLPNNTSWRFMDAKQSLSATNPWPINEEVNISSLAADMMSEDFVGAKVGDVNGSVIANANEVITESRSSNQLEFVIENYEGSVLVKAGANFDNVYGYQFSMKAEGELSNVYAAALDVSDQNFGVLVDGQITTSFASETAVSLTEGEVLFTLEGVNAIQLINGFTKAEAYFGNDLQIGAIALREDKSNFSYSLSQNEPNPFSETTTIAFTVAKPGLAVLSVYDVTGKVIKTIEADYEKGKHVIQLNKRDLSRTGVLYYQLESGDFTASKKMIIID